MSNLLKNIIDKEYKYQEENNIWNDSIFEKINLLKNDHSGNIGEKFISNICLENSISCEYNENINSQDDGTYDLKIKNMRIEIKTARFGNNKSFQHENLHQFNFKIILNILTLFLNYLKLTDSGYVTLSCSTRSR